MKCTDCEHLEYVKTAKKYRCKKSRQFRSPDDVCNVVMKKKTSARGIKCKDCKYLQYGAWKRSEKSHKLSPGYQCTLQNKFKSYTAVCDCKKAEKLSTADKLTR